MVYCFYRVVYNFLSPPANHKIQINLLYLNHFHLVWAIYHQISLTTDFVLFALNSDEDETNELLVIAF